MCEEPGILHRQLKRIEEIGCKQMARSFKSKNTTDFLVDYLQVFKDKQIQVLLSEKDKANIKLTFWEQC